MHPITHHHAETTLAGRVEKLDQATRKLENKAERFRGLLTDFETIDLAGHLRAV